MLKELLTCIQEGANKDVGGSGIGEEEVVEEIGVVGVSGCSQEAKK
jgi:hypothetical protein